MLQLLLCLLFAMGTKILRKQNMAINKDKLFNRVLSNKIIRNQATDAG